MPCPEEICHNLTMHISTQEKFKIGLGKWARFTIKDFEITMSKEDGVEINILKSKVAPLNPPWVHITSNMSFGRPGISEAGGHLSP